MKVIRDRLGLDSAPDRGFSLVEVMVAMFIFGLVAIGLIYTMTSVMVVNRDSRVRQVATNLAAQEIDLARDIENVPNFGGGGRTVTLNGDTFTVERSSNWVQNPDEITDSCGTGGGTLKYKRIHVKVTWGGMRGTTGVTSDTLINPNERINDPDLGTLMVTVKNGTGTGLGGVTVNARLSTGGNVVATSTTDSNGCAYLLKVPPATYELTVVGPASETYVDVATNATPTAPAVSLAGQASSATFTIAEAGFLDVDYRHDGSNISLAQLPTNLGTTLISTTNTLLSERNSAFPKIPVASGVSFTAIAGDMRNCAAIDPQQWPASDPDDREEGVRQPAVTLNPRQTLDVNLPMRRVKVDGFRPGTGGGDRNLYLLAVADTARAPGCAAGVEYYFTPRNSSSREMTIALPYGNWNLFTGDTPSHREVAVPANRITVSSSDYLNGSIVVLDPRPED